MAKIDASDYKRKSQYRVGHAMPWVTKIDRENAHAIHIDVCKWGADSACEAI